MPLLTFLSGPLGKWAIGAAAALAAVAAFVIWLHVHDDGVLAAQAARDQAAAAAAQAAEAAAAEQALTDQAAAEAARAAQETAAKQDIDHAPDAQSANHDDAVARALDRLRH